MLWKKSGCSKIARSLHPQNAPRRRSTLWGINSATPHKVAFEDGGEMGVFQQPQSARSAWLISIFAFAFRSLSHLSIASCCFFGRSDRVN
ncbi:hypothetical protein SAMN06269301_0072 [Geobacter sp. DSM 9736]|nr:hypothetical protein SAMN06269301_0072 [Geobacter sp. DSM 9736]